MKRRTVALIRVLRRSRRRRIPRQRQPDLIRSEYYRALLPFIEIAHRAFRSIRADLLAIVEANNAKMDAEDDQRVQDMIKRAAKLTAEMFRPTELEAVAKKFGQRTSVFSRNELDRQVRAAMGVNIDQLGLKSFVDFEAYAKENVDLIVTIQGRYFSRIERDVIKALQEGTNVRTLAKQLDADYGSAETDTMRIARDQIGKLNAQMNEENQKQLGITGYIWRTAQDNRVRDEHAELEGNHYEWDDPPDAGTDGEPAHPGEAIQCRCYAEPDFGPILEAL